MRHLSAFSYAAQTDSQQCCPCTRGVTVRSMLHLSRSKRRTTGAAAAVVFALVASVLTLTPAQAVSDTGTGGVFVAATGRVLDTKVGTGGYTTAMPANTYRSVPVAGVAGLPDDGSVGAVSVIVTASEISSPAAVFGRPDANTDSTMMGFYGSDKTSFPAVLAVGADGSIQVKSQTSVRMSIDVQGYYTSTADGAAPGGFVPVNGARVVDTRSGLGVPKGTLTDGGNVTVQIAGTAGVPAGASGAIVTLTAANSASTAGYFTPYAAGATRPGTVLAYGASSNTSVQAQVPLSADGKITIYNRSSTPHLTVDVQGYFTASNGGGATFTPGTGRVFDSRTSGTATLAANETRAITVAGQVGVPTMNSGLTAVVFTLTAAKAGSSGRAIVWADGTTRPDTTALNFSQGDTVSNTITVPLGANGKIDLLNYASATDYVIDIQGWYADPQAPSITCPAGYANNTLVTSIPTAPIDCTVSVGTAAQTGDELAVSIDAVDDPTISLSDTVPMTNPVTIPNTPGEHTVVAARRNGDSIHLTSYEFILGDWRSNNYAANAATATVPLEPTLPVPDGTVPLPSDAKIRYSVFTDAQSTTALVVSDWMDGSWKVPAATLQDGATYYWSAEIQASYDYSGATDTVTTGRRTIVASSAATEDTTGAVTDSDGDGDQSPVSSLVRPVTTMGACNTGKYFNEVTSSTNSWKALTQKFSAENRTSRAISASFQTEKAGSYSASLTGTIEGGVQAGVVSAKASVSGTIQKTVSWSATLGVSATVPAHKTVYAQLGTRAYKVYIDKAKYNGRCVRTVVSHGTLTAPSTTGWKVTTS